MDEEDFGIEFAESNQSVWDKEDDRGNLENEVAKILENNFYCIENLSISEEPRIGRPKLKTSGRRESKMMKVTRVQGALTMDV